MQLSTSNIIGKAAETLVCEYLQKQGLKFVAANYRCKCGEIDLIMQDNATIVFVEVRHRQNKKYGEGFDTVTKAKQQKIIKAATYYLQKNRLTDRISCRFDVVATSFQEQMEIIWIKDAFWQKW